MTSSRVYFQPRDYVIAAVHDVKELQNGKGTFDDIPNGIINFTVRMYHLKYELQFKVTDIGRNRCKVEIGIVGDVKEKEEKILREYALLDNMLAANTQIEIMNAEQAEEAAQVVQVASSSEQKPLPRRATKLVTIAAVCVAIIAIVGISLHFAKQSPDSDSPYYRTSAHAPPIDSNARVYTGTEQEIIDNHGLKILGYTTATIPAGTTDVSLLLLNPKDNVYSLTFEIVLEDAEETLYKSGLVEPGMVIEDITLTNKLRKGEHEATLRIRAYGPDGPVQTGGVDIDFILAAQ